MRSGKINLPKCPGDLEEVVSRGDAVDGEDGEPGVFPGPGPEEVAGGGGEESAEEEGDEERGFIDELEEERAGDGDEVRVGLQHPESGEPDGGQDVGGEEAGEEQEVMTAGHGRVSGGRCRGAMPWCSPQNMMALRAASDLEQAIPSSTAVSTMQDSGRPSRKVSRAGLCRIVYS